MADTTGADRNYCRRADLQPDTVTHESESRLANGSTGQSAGGGLLVPSYSNSRVCAMNIFFAPSQVQTHAPAYTAE
jgi:hypothetical protein